MILWQVIRQTGIPLVVALALGLAAGIALGAQDWGSTEPMSQPAAQETQEPSPEPATGTPSPTPGTPAPESQECGGIVSLLLVAVQATQGGDDYSFIADRAPREGGNVRTIPLPFSREALEEKEAEILQVAEESDATVLLVRLDSGEAQVALASKIARQVGPQLFLLAGGDPARIDSLREQVEHRGAKVFPLGSVRQGSDLMSSADRNEAWGWLKDGIPCLGRQEST